MFSGLTNKGSFNVSNPLSVRREEMKVCHLGELTEEISLWLLVSSSWARTVTSAWNCKWHFSGWYPAAPQGKTWTTHPASTHSFLPYGDWNIGKEKMGHTYSLEKTAAEGRDLTVS